VADAVVDLFLCPIQGRLSADISVAIRADRFFAGSVSQLMGCRLREKCSGATTEFNSAPPI